MRCELSSISEVITLLEEQTRWLRILAMPQLHAAVQSALPTTQERNAFELCDGSHAGTDIARLVGVNKSTVSRWFKCWREAGIAYEDSSGRPRHLIGLTSMGVTLDPGGDR
jgi:IS30 family transposase